MFLWSHSPNQCQPPVFFPRTLFFTRMCLFPTLLRNFKNKNCNLFTFIVTDFCVYHKLSKQQPTIKDQVCINKHHGVQNEAGQRLTELCQENALVIANTLFQQHKRRLYTWTSPDGQHQNQIDCILCSQRWRSSVQSAKTRLGADCGSDHQLLIAKFKLKLKKVEKTTRTFGYDLNQIPYDYTLISVAY